jgi:hypothetical protein
VKAKELIKHSALFIVAFASFGLSIIASINLADYPIDTYFSALWGFIQLVISLAGLFVLPVIMLSLLLRIINIAMQPPMKRKNTSANTIAS